MRHLFTLPALCGACALAAPPAPEPAAPPSSAPLAAPAYAGDRLVRPEDYRQWIYLTTGFDMSYNPTLRMGHHMFDNVFVDPAAWRAFRQTGTWPDRTLLVLEARGARDKGSINRQGQYQDGEVMALEVHVRDTARYPDGGWAFFVFDGSGREAARIPQQADCYACHQAHGAEDTTFVQFYPTLLPLATAKGTLAAAYRAEAAAGSSP